MVKPYIDQRWSLGTHLESEPDHSTRRDSGVGPVQNSLDSGDGGNEHSDGVGRVVLRIGERGTELHPAHLEGKNVIDLRRQ